MKLKTLKDKIENGYLRQALERSGNFTQEEIMWLVSVFISALASKVAPK